MWLCIRFPLLPLEALFDSSSNLSSVHHSRLKKVASESTLAPPAPQHISQLPMAVSENNKIICCNHLASQQGVLPQQSLSTSYTLVDKLKVVERNINQEQQVLQHIAIVLSIFSPAMHLCLPDCIQLEIGRSIRLFHGLDALITHVEQTLKPFLITFKWAIAPTPKMAEVFSLGQQQASKKCWLLDSQAISPSQCLALLRKLPINQLFLSSQVKQRVSSLGIKYIGELIALPLPSLRKRLGNETVKYIQQLVGKLPDSPKNFQLPEKFVRDLEFIDVIHHRESLLFPIQKLLNELCCFLRLQQKNTQLLSWSLRDSYQETTEFKVQLAEPEHAPKVPFEITKLKLEHIALTGPIEALSLKVTQFTNVQALSGSLFLQSEDFNESLTFVSKIRAHLGDKSCYWLQQTSEVIPELTQKARVQYQAIESLQKKTKKNSMSHLTQNLSAIESNPRPSWLFETPQKIGHLESQLFWNGRLSIISQEERIAGYWWKKPVSRDYFIAQHSSGPFYWIFFDHHKEQWFVHGIYS